MQNLLDCAQGQWNSHEWKGGRKGADNNLLISVAYLSLPFPIPIGRTLFISCYLSLCLIREYRLPLSLFLPIDRMISESSNVVQDNGELSYETADDDGKHLTGLDYQNISATLPIKSNYSGFSKLPLTHANMAWLAKTIPEKDGLFLNLSQLQSNRDCLGEPNIFLSFKKGTEDKSIHT